MPCSLSTRRWKAFTPTASLSQDDRRAKMMDIHKATDAQIRGILDSTQQKKWDEMQAKREQRMQGHHPDADSNQAPPPQQ